jgi:hypothetical protein
LIWLHDEPVDPGGYISAEEEWAAMRKHRIFQVFAVGLAAAVVSGTCAAQEHRGTMQQQMACTPDVFRLCGAAIPDENRIVACLQANTPQLSGPCRAVFESSDSANQPPPRNGPQPIAPPVRQYQYQYHYQ